MIYENLEKENLSNPNSSSIVAPPTSNVPQDVKDFSKAVSTRLPFEPTKRSGSQFERTNRYNPCPVCDEGNGDCRIQGDLVHCHTYVDARLKEVVGNYICTKEASGHTATFTEFNPTFQQGTPWQLRKVSITKTETTVARALPEMSLEERDQEYRRFLSLLELNASDRENLRQRKLTDDQIDRGQFKSVTKCHTVNESFPPNLPGIGSSGVNQSRLYNSGDGILCPIWQGNLIIGCEIRLTKLQEGDKSRYRLASSKGSINIQDESPIPFLLRTAEQKQIYVTEGRGLKPRIVNLRFDVPVIGYARFMHLYQNQAEKILGLIDTESEIILCPDAGDILNKHVREKWIAEYEFYQSKGFNVRFGWWGQVTKDDKDIDELDSLENIALINLEQFQTLIEEHQIASKHAYIETAKEKDFQNWSASQKFTPSIIINDGEPRFKFPKGLPNDKVILSVKAGMGTGKSEAFLNLMLEEKTTDKGWVLIGCLNNLLIQIINRGAWKGLDITLLKKKSQEDIKELLGRKNAHLACCLDSIFKLDGHFEGRTIVMDENCSVFFHGLSGGTLGYRQAQILAMFKRAIRECKQIILLDANNSDFFTDEIAKIAPDKKVIKILKESNYIPQNFKIIEGIGDSEEDIKKRDKSAIINLLMQSGGKQFIFSDSKKLTNSLYKILTELGRKGYVINKDTVSEPWANSFLSTPDKFIEEMQPDFLIVSPSCNSGISIDIVDYFTTKFTIFTGVVTTNKMRQALFRVRDPKIPHYICCPENGQSMDKKIPKFFHVQALNKALQERVHNNAILATFSANCKESATEIFNKKILEAEQDPFYGASLQIMALENYECAYLRKCLVHTLQEDGHVVEIVKLNISENTKKKIGEKNAENNEEEAKGIYLAEKIEDEEEYKKLSQDPPNKAAYQRVQRTDISKKLPGIDKDEEIWTEKLILDYWVDGNKSKIYEHEQFFFLNHPEVAQKRHEENMYFATTQQNIYFNSLIGYGSLRIDALHKLNIMQFFNPEREWCKCDPEIITLYETIKNSKDIQSKLNYQLQKEQTNGRHLVSTLKDILNWVGIKFKKPTQKLNSNGERVRYYKIDDKHFNSKERLAILKAHEIKHSEWLASDKSQQFDWVPWEKQAQILADKFRAVTSYEEFLNLQKQLYSQKKDENEFDKQEHNARHNAKIDSIVAKAKALLTFEEEIKIYSLKPIESLDNLIAKIEAQVVSKQHAKLINKIEPNTKSHTHTEYSLEFFRAQNANTRWGLLLEEAIEFGIPNTLTVFNAAQKALGTAINKIVSYLPDNAKQIYQEYIIPNADPIEAVSHKQQPLTVITSENVVELAANCKSVEEALKITDVAYGLPLNKLGECLHLIGDRLRRTILDTGKYLHQEIRKCLRSHYESFIDGIPIMGEEEASLLWMESQYIEEFA